MNPWPMIGGTAIVMCPEDEWVPVNQGQPGDKLLLTKPLGTQVAVNLNEWLNDENKKWEESSSILDAIEAKERYYLAVESMSCLNKNGAYLMKKHGAHGATDVTGFGIRGHAQNLCEVQKADVNMHITHLPIIDGMEKINDSVFNFRLTEGYSAETSGGLLMMIAPDKAKAL